MRHAPIDASLFIDNRARLAAMLPAGALAVVNANDVLPTNADGTLAMHPNSDLFYLTGIEQEESVLLLFPTASEPKHREILFVREPSETLRIWEGHKHSKDEAKQISGIESVRWLSDLDGMLRQLMLDAQEVFLNSNEHRRSTTAVQSRDDRFIVECRARFPLHHYHRLAPLLHRLRVVKSAGEIDLLRKAIDITGLGFRRVAQVLKPGVNECEIEAEFASEFIRRRAKFSYTPIVASGERACVLHYISNDQSCRKGELVLMDVGASYANYNSDLTRTLPVSGRFSRRQREVYDAVLRVMRASIAGATVGKLHSDWTKEAQAMMGEELLGLGLLKRSDLRKQKPDQPACRKYFMHGLGHPLGLDVHDVGYMHAPFAAGWVLTVEPGIYIPDEQMGIRLENNILLTESGPVDLTEKIPVEAEAIEELMRESRGV